MLIGFDRYSSRRIMRPKTDETVHNPGEEERQRQAEWMSKFYQLQLVKKDLQFKNFLLNTMNTLFLQHNPRKCPVTLLSCDVYKHV